MIYRCFEEMQNNAEDESVKYTQIVLQEFEEFLIGKRLSIIDGQHLVDMLRERHENLPLRNSYDPKNHY